MTRKPPAITISSCGPGNANGNNRSPPSSPSHIKRSIKGSVRQLFGLRGITADRYGGGGPPLSPVVQDQAQDYSKDNKDAFAMTLTAEVQAQAETDTVVVVYPELRFLPHDGTHFSPPCDLKGSVHYDPQTNHVALGTCTRSNEQQRKRHFIPGQNNKTDKTVWLSIDEYAWIIRSLQEEQGVHDALSKATRRDPHTAFHPLKFTRCGAYVRPFHAAPTPILGILHGKLSATNTQTFSRRLSRLILQRAKSVSSSPQHLSLLFLPKSLLLHSSTYVPVTKSLPSASLNCHDCSPFSPISPQCYTRLHRYAQLAALAAYDMTPSDRLRYATQSSSNIPAITVTDPAAQVEHQPYDGSTESVFSVSFFRTLWSTHSCRDSGMPESVSLEEPRRRTLDLPRPHHHHPVATKAQSTIDYVDDSVISDELPSSSGCLSSGSLSFSFGELEKHGYVTIDDQNEEIVVVFPGMSPTDRLFENASFAAVPWFEGTGGSVRRKSSFKKRTGIWLAKEDDFERGDNDKEQEENGNLGSCPWVLECALSAWRRCEISVATAVMRASLAAPSHYRVVIIGHSLGGAVASLCAYSLVSTGLLVDRQVRLCTFHSPRVGNTDFANQLAQRVETIRVTHVSDLLSHSPPRTSGLIHAGNITVLDTSPVPHKVGHNDTVMIQNGDLGWIEDQISRAFALCPYNEHHHYSIWGVNFDSGACRNRFTHDNTKARP